MAVEWIRGCFVSLVESYYDSVELDMSDLMGKLSAMNDPEEIQRMFGTDAEDPTGFMKADSDPDKLAKIQAFTAFIEGYGDHIVRLAGTELLPGIERIEDAYTVRRTEPDKAEQFLQQFAGLELQRWRSKDGTAFCMEVTDRWGAEALAKVWDDPENLPTLDELTDPIGWNARVLLSESFLDDE
jgi:putative hydrolase